MVGDYCMTNTVTMPTHAQMPRAVRNDANKCSYYLTFFLTFFLIPKPSKTHTHTHTHTHSHKHTHTSTHTHTHTHAHTHTHTHTHTHKHNNLQIQIFIDILDHFAIVTVFLLESNFWTVLSKIVQLYSNLYSMVCSGAERALRIYNNPLLMAHKSFSLAMMLELM